MRKGRKTQLGYPPWRQRFRSIIKHIVCELGRCPECRKKLKNENPACLEHYAIACEYGHDC